MTWRAGMYDVCESRAENWHWQTTISCKKSHFTALFVGLDRMVALGQVLRFIFQPFAYCFCAISSRSRNTIPSHLHMTIGPFCVASVLFPMALLIIAATLATVVALLLLGAIGRPSPTAQRATFCRVRVH